METIHCIKTPLSGERGKVTTFQVPDQNLQEAEIQLKRFLAANQDPNSNFPTFPFQLDDADYGSLLVWPEQLYFAFKLTGMHTTLDAIIAWLDFYDINVHGCSISPYKIIPTN